MGITRDFSTRDDTGRGRESSDPVEPRLAGHREGIHGLMAQTKYGVSVRHTSFTSLEVIHRNWLKTAASRRKKGMHQWVTSLLVTFLIRHWLSLFSDWMDPDLPHHE